MKNLIWIIAALLMATACGMEDEESKLVDIRTVGPADTVFICTGSGSKRFHANNGCAGIVSCTKAIQPVTRQDAEKRTRSFCHICFRDSIE